MKTLIIGYGNDSRNDDGAGWFVIEELTKFALPGVTLETTHQLEVDFAETIRDFDQVIFVDAAIPESSAPWSSEPVTPGFTSHAVAHFLTPADVLGLCRTLYGQAPRGVAFSVRGHDFNFGTDLSPDVKVAGTAVVGEIITLLTCHSESLGARLESDSSGTPSPASVVCPETRQTDAGDGVPPNDGTTSAGPRLAFRSELL